MNELSSVLLPIFKVLKKEFNIDNTLPIFLLQKFGNNIHEVQDTILEVKSKLERIGSSGGDSDMVKEIEDLYTIFVGPIDHTNISDYNVFSNNLLAEGKVDSLLAAVQKAANKMLE